MKVAACFETTRNPAVDFRKTDSVLYRRAATFTKNIQANSNPYLKRLAEIADKIREGADGLDLTRLGERDIYFLEHFLQGIAAVIKESAKWQMVVLRDFVEGFDKESLQTLKRLVENDRKILHKEETLNFLERYL